ncbi:MAG TPA: thioredoxin family protein [Bacteroidales bacterium]|jgi:thioredoxin 1|nr:thioredoxin family protein [Bacteroidales bacterium]OQB59592.1 MAG: Thioredoxin [Bacteroidetes bacterium ADurb.Bin145]HOU03252.1 thioredoxin family protein [Bacteroidales bacterium]HQK69284.1 thioredoxin family protein [Bacteroidales bacterium]
MKIQRKLFLLFVILTAIVLNTDCSGQSSKAEDKTGNETGKYKVTFIELGSVRCIPCQQMQPIMKSVEEKYGKDVKVVFHDVWTEAGAPYAKQYGIEAIPTQVFLDKDGKEFFRHVGYFPEDELVKVLQQKGVKQ